MKLGIGTAQLGQKYGLNNKKGKIERDEFLKILKTCKSFGVTTIDTAIAYGNAEEVLGDFDISDFNIITKISEIPGGNNPAEYVPVQIQKSLQRMHLAKLGGVLLHNPNQIFTKLGNELIASLLKSRDMGLVNKIGVSVYTTDELRRVLSQFKPDIIQLPVSIFDRSLERSGLIETLKKNNIEVHARSVFLQGLLLLEPNEIPSKFTRWKINFQNFEQWLVQNKLTRLSVCLNYVYSLPFVDRVIVGVDNEPQLAEMLNFLGQPIPWAPDFIQTGDRFPINPSEWHLL